MSFREHWAVAVATFSRALIMEGECDNSSANTVLHEDFCRMNNIPLCLKKGATAVPERTGEYSFVFLVSPKVSRMCSPVKEPSMCHLVLGEAFQVSAGSVESINFIVTESFDSAVRDFDLSLLSQVSETPSDDALDSGVPASVGVLTPKRGLGRPRQQFEDPAVVSREQESVQALELAYLRTLELQALVVAHCDLPPLRSCSHLS